MYFELACEMKNMAKQLHEQYVTVTKSLRRKHTLVKAATKAHKPVL